MTVSPVFGFSIPYKKQLPVFSVLSVLSFFRFLLFLRVVRPSLPHYPLTSLPLLSEPFTTSDSQPTTSPLLYFCSFVPLYFLFHVRRSPLPPFRRRRSTPRHHSRPRHLLRPRPHTCRRPPRRLSILLRHFLRRTLPRLRRRPRSFRDPRRLRRRIPHRQI